MVVTERHGIAKYSRREEREGKAEKGSAKKGV